MKKRILAASLALVLLVTGGIGGFVYAQSDHEPMVGQKLVGHGLVATWPGDTTKVTWTYCITNTDCSRDIEIERISFIDWDGSLIWEGKYSELMLLIGKTGDDILVPHEGVTFSLWRLFEYGVLPKNRHLTVEVYWSGHNQTTPLSGWAFKVNRDAAGIVLSQSTTLMVNMEQKPY